MQTPLTKIHQNAFYNYLVLITEALKDKQWQRAFFAIKFKNQKISSRLFVLLNLSSNILIVTHELKILLILPP